MAVAPYRHFTAEDKRRILDTVEQIGTMNDVPVRDVLAQLDVPPATYYRWKARATRDRLEDARTQRGRPSVPPTPQERAAICAFARLHPLMGYKRLTWDMVDRDIAYLRPGQVYQALQAADLLARRPPLALDPLRRPTAPMRPDQVWHIDLMYLHIAPRWYYLVDILDGYSRYLVHWTLNMTMHADLVMLTVQEALEKLPSRRGGEPQLVHDHGSQFVSREWRTFVMLAGVGDIKTRVAHPESNGRIERLHRMHREEGLVDHDVTDYAKATAALTRWQHYYNNRRPHSALRYLRPVDYYRGNPEVRLAERREKLRRGLALRQLYWKEAAHSEAVGG